MRSALIFLNVTSYSLFFLSGEGIGLGEILFFLIQGVTLCFFGVNTCSKLLVRDRKLTTITFFSICMILLLIVAIFHGILRGNDTFSIFNEITFFLPIFLSTFLILDNIVEHDIKVFLYSFLSLGLIICVYNLFNYQQIILNATFAWKVEKARVATGEIVIVFNLILLITSTYLKSPNLVLKLFRYSFILLHFVALIITQSRGFWLLAVLSIAHYIIFSKMEVKLKLISFTVLLSPILLYFSLKYSSQISLISSGLYERITSLSSVSKDLSLRERLIEYDKILDIILQNPISGYGFGTYYMREYIVLGHSIPKMYIHNAYYSMLYKFGFVGLITFVGFHITLVLNLFQKYFVGKYNALGHTLILFTFLLFGLNLSSPQYYSAESMLIFAFLAVYTQNRFEV